MPPFSEVTSYIEGTKEEGEEENVLTFLLK
jgi:hypothetical protein